MFLQPSIHLRLGRRTSRGFTLIELVVVVVIIGIASALAAPSVSAQLRERRARDTAHRIALLYSTARMRALGRGSAVMVNYAAATGFTVLESIEGVAAATGFAASRATCAAQPGLGCLTNNWANPGASQQVGSLTAASDIAVTVNDSAGNPTPAMSICFTPMGRSFISVVAGAPPTTPMVGAATVNVMRMDASVQVGLLRTVAILPNGMSRVGL